MTNDNDEWLIQKRDEALDNFENATEPQAYQFAAEAETYERIKNDTLPFGGVREALSVYRETMDSPDYGMAAGRVRAIERYLEEEDYQR